MLKKLLYLFLFSAVSLLASCEDFGLDFPALFVTDLPAERVVIKSQVNKSSLKEFHVFNGGIEENSHIIVKKIELLSGKDAFSIFSSPKNPFVLSGKEKNREKIIIRFFPKSFGSFRGELKVFFTIDSRMKGFDPDETFEYPLELIGIIKEE